MLIKDVRKTKMIKNRRSPRRFNLRAEPVKAVHDADLQQLLEDLEIWNKFQARKLSCSFCGDVITWDNLHAIFPDSGAVKLSCHRPECVEKLTTKLYAKKLP